MIDPNDYLIAFKNYLCQSSNSIDMINVVIGRPPASGVSLKNATTHSKLFKISTQALLEKAKKRFEEDLESKELS